ncbi:MAG: (2Fe-2S)-binding protein [candidate division KSB1 bacterium]|nr:(2Fe-2S)-binding protein [candidate division KSB1 bacterium]MDZ7273842.1 (2Fe-2S)-binding protein [candidate division KSB1 bacterium]MDZ7285998.1 (2Fe-2S)-binding protein [candidate division KSB1 bacterium]MDZ7299030.1 (2Fe-2S)-binding protein [candidate division KSB1 bacterium]MDZ7307999.1 (2Fe-2S)-binding protein [candidate division KSB1 bacterium]
MEKHSEHPVPTPDPSETSPAGQTSTKISRRHFLKLSGGGAVSTVILSTGLRAKAAAMPPDVEVFSGNVPLQLKVNGQRRSLTVEPRTTLLSALRNQLEVTGCKEVCNRGECGACTVLLNGRPVLACMMLALDAAGREIVTVEGLVQNGKLDPVQQAFVDRDALMCGFCTPGFVMSVRALLDRNPNPTAAEVRQAVAGNLCRCGTYPRVFEAALAAAKSAGGKRG